LGVVVAEKNLLDQFVSDGASGHVYRALDLYMKRHYAAKVIEFAGKEVSELDAPSARRWRSPVRKPSRRSGL
jgi:hypothetical protein